VSQLLRDEGAGALIGDGEAFSQQLVVGEKDDGARDAELFGEIAGGGQAVTGLERAGEDGLTQAAVDLAKQGIASAGKWYCQLHKKWLFENTIRSVNLMKRTALCERCAAMIYKEDRMRHTWRLGAASLLLGLIFVSWPSRTGTAAAEAQPSRDGQHDFDPLFGMWKYHLKRLEHPLSGSQSWVYLTGTGATYRIWAGRAQMDTFEADGSTGHIEGLTLRLYDPQAHQWRLCWANSRIGIVDPPQIGEFKDGQGDFYTQDRINGKVILVRYDWTRMTGGTPHFEQSFSDDGGKNWEVNWITDQVRTGDSPAWDVPRTTEAEPASESSEPTPNAAGAAQHDFDFDYGTWKIHMRRLLHPLTGSTVWTEMDGRTVTRKIWNGSANLAVVEADGTAGHLELLALRLYDPQARQWRIHFATSDEGILSVPAIGEVHDGRGDFYDQELYRGRSILVRFRIWANSADSLGSDQAFSEDGRQTWETNWVNAMTRVKAEER